MNMNDITVMVVTHKNYEMPTDSMYVPIAVGPNKNNLKQYPLRDDAGENIAQKNDQYSELTAIYWAWKNLKSNYVGVVHYRRYMCVGKCKNLSGVLTNKQAKELLQTFDILVVKPRKYIESVANHYINCHKSQHENCRKQLKIMSDVIHEIYPEYSESFYLVMNGHKAHMFNMFIMKKTDFDAYCAWMFPILFKPEELILKNNVSYERLMGSLSEFLLDTWLVQNKKRIRELNLYQTELDFFKRVKRFIYRRLFD